MGGRGSGGGGRGGGAAGVSDTRQIPMGKLPEELQGAGRARVLTDAMDGKDSFATAVSAGISRSSNFVSVLIKEPPAWLVGCGESFCTPGRCKEVLRWPLNGPA